MDRDAPGVGGTAAQSLLPVPSPSASVSVLLFLCECEMDTRLATLTIPVGQTVSNEILEDVLKYIRNLTIGAPAGLAETITIEVQLSQGNWYTLQSNGVDINLVANKATVLMILPATGLRLRSAVAVAAARSFALVGEEEGS